MKKRQNGHFAHNLRLNLRDYYWYMTVLETLSAKVVLSKIKVDILRFPKSPY